MPRTVRFTPNTKKVTIIIYTNLSQFNKGDNISKYILLDLDNFYYHLVNKISIDNNLVVTEQVKYDLI